MAKRVLGVLEFWTGREVTKNINRNRVDGKCFSINLIFRFGCIEQRPFEHDVFQAKASHAIKGLFGTRDIWSVKIVRIKVSFAISE